MAKRYKVALLFFLVVCVSKAVYGKGIDETTAKNVAASFLGSAGVSTAGNDTLTIVYTALDTIDGIPVTDFYVFNAGAYAFVIISGTDMAKPVLAYSWETAFHPSVRNDNAAYWLQSYQQQISYALKNNVKPSAEIRAAWAAIKQAGQYKKARTTSVAPMLTTKWAQYPFFNDWCPYDPLMKAHAVTGCVATAMAQLMKYWNWPGEGCGSHSYTDVLYGTQSVNYSAAQYQWGNMPDSVSGPNDAVAQLMYHAGVSVNMDYGVNGSGAWVIPGDNMTSNTCAYALKTYFHYKTSLLAVPRWQNNHTAIAASGGSVSISDSFTTTQWMGMLTAELDAGRPVIYAGAGNLSAGHCWVCDGYDGNGLFHFNWGWGGVGNGYFSLDAAGGFSLYQEAIFGIMPDTFSVQTGDIQLLAALSGSNTPLQYGQPISVSAKIVNRSSKVFTGDFCAQVFDSLGVLKGTMQTITARALTAGDSTPVLTFAINAMYGLVPGIYNVRIMCRAEGGAQWLPVSRGSGGFINYWPLGIANDTDVMVYSPFQIDTLVHGKPALIDAYITVMGKARFSGSLDLALYDINTGARLQTVGQQKGVVMDAYSDHSFTFTDSALFVPPGQYILALKHQYNDSGSYYLTGSSWMPNPMIVTVGGVKDYNSSRIYVYPNPARDVIYIDPYNQVLSEIRIVDLQGRIMKTFTSLPQHTIISINTFNVPGGLYFIQMQTAGRIVTEKIIIIN